MASRSFRVDLIRTKVSEALIEIKKIKKEIDDFFENTTFKDTQTKYFLIFPVGKTEIDRKYNSYVKLSCERNFDEVHAFLYNLHKLCVEGNGNDQIIISEVELGMLNGKGWPRLKSLEQIDILQKDWDELHGSCGPY